MALINPHKQTIFIHVYKTGGTSLRSLVGGYEVCDMHAPAWQVKDHFRGYREQDTWGEYFTFAVVRNPYDFVASLYNHVHNQKSHIFHHTAKGNIDEFVYGLQHWFHNSRFMGFEFFRPQWYFVALGQELLVDKVFRFENLNDCFQELHERFGTKKDGVALNVAKRERNIPYTEMYKPSTIELINHLYHNDFVGFGYDKIMI